MDACEIYIYMIEENIFIIYLKVREGVASERNLKQKNHKCHFSLGGRSMTAILSPAHNITSLLARATRVVPLL